MEPIVIPFKPAYEDWLHARRILRRKEKLHYLFDFGLPAGMCTGLILAMVQHPFSMVAFLIGTLAIIGLATGPFLLRRWKWKRNWRKTEQELFIEISDESVSVSSKSAIGNSHSSVRWAAIKAFEEDSRVFFFLTKGSMLFIPKNDVPNDQAETIRRLASTKVVVAC